MAINLYNMDCMEALAKMPDKAYDLAIVDPPYGINKIWVGGKGHGWGKASEESNKREWDNNVPPIVYWENLKRVSINQIVWGGNYFVEYLGNSRCWLIWNKPERGFSLSEAELAWTSFDKVVRVFDYHRNETGRNHPTQKPVKLYEWLLRNYAKEGDKILDTHLGSGSISIACYNMGFSLDGYELDKDYYEAAVKRLDDHKRQGVLFEPRAVYGH